MRSLRITGACIVVCVVDVDDDALVFDPQSVETARISEDADYEGVRATFKGQFGKVTLAMQIDFGFSDVITPGPIEITYPTVLDHPPAKLRAYNRETVVAEKFEAMVKLGELNSRMKDFFDVWILAQTFEFDEHTLADAIVATFARRKTDPQVEPACFTNAFSDLPSKTVQWKGFIKTARVENAPVNFPDVIARVHNFLQPVAVAIVNHRKHVRQWPPGGPWVER